MKKSCFSFVGSGSFVSVDLHFSGIEALSIRYGGHLSVTERADKHAGTS